jgi:hypothetical protein
MCDPLAGIVAKVRTLPTISTCSDMHPTQHANSEYYHNISHNEIGTKVNNNCGRSKKLRVPNSSEIEFDFPSMQTMDRRVSSSSDQIDFLRKQKMRAKPLRTHSSSRLDYERTTEVNNDSDFVTGKIHRKCDLRSSSFHQNIPRKEGDLTKTPFALFLQDDGPYSRKLFGPLATRDREEPCRGRQKKSPGYRGESNKDKVKIISNYK